MTECFLNLVAIRKGAVRRAETNWEDGPLACSDHSTKAVMHVLQVCVPLLSLFRALWRLSVAQCFAAPVVAAKVDEDKTRGNIVLQEEVKMAKTVSLFG